MSGGGRRPPSTRRNSPAKDSRRSITPPARRNINGNAGYAAVVHDSHGRFSSKVTAMQEEASTFHGIDAGVQQQVAEFPKEGATQGEGSVVATKDSIVPIDEMVAGGTTSSIAVEDSRPMLRDEDMQSTVLPCMQNVCDNDPVIIQGRSSLENDGGCPVNHEGIDVNCHKAPSSSLNHISDVCMDSGEDEIPVMHGNCSQPSSMQGVCHNASSKQHTGSAIPSVWKKQGVVPLPSLKDLGNPPCHNGAAQLDAEEVNGYMDRFRSALVGRLFGRHFPYYHLNNELHRRWDGFGSFKLLTLSQDCFICFFEDASARDAILMAGPWAIAGQVVGLDVWTPSFSPSTMHGFITPIWIRFPGLPLYCWGKKSLTRIASILGEPIWIDEATAEMSRASYARVCIRADLSKPLVSLVHVMGFDGPFQQQVEYECLATLCFRCGRVGHKDSRCPTQASQPCKPQATNLCQSPQDSEVHPIMVPKPSQSSLEAAVGISNMDSHLGLKHLVNNSHSHSSSIDDASLQTMKDHEDGFGPWMVVQHRRRKSAQHKQPKFMGPPLSRGNRWNSLVQSSGMDKVQAQISSPPPMSGVASTTVQGLNVESNNMDCPPLKQPEPELVQAEPVPVPHESPEVPMIFSYKQSSSALDMVADMGGTRLNGIGKDKSKAKGSKSRVKQVMYDAGPLIQESHKKRKPSIQSNGEDASSSAPG